MRMVINISPVFNVSVAAKAPIPSDIVSTSQPSPITSKFRVLADAWRRETRTLSSVQAKIFNLHYQRIMAMGPAVLPLIFEELKARGGHWHWALECITGDNPAEQAPNMIDVKQVWLSYGIEHGYIA
jgi:hypothetical protein